MDTELVDLALQEIVIKGSEALDYCAGCGAYLTALLGAAVTVLGIKALRSKEGHIELLKGN